MQLVHRYIHFRLLFEGSDLLIQATAIEDTFIAHVDKCGSKHRPIEFLIFWGPTTAAAAIVLEFDTLAEFAPKDDAGLFGSSVGP
jgi:hypothetical protein